MKKEIIIFESNSIYENDIPENANEFMKYFQDKLDLAPNEYKNVVIINLK